MKEEGRMKEEGLPVLEQKKRTFVGITVRYPDPAVCCFPEYKGKPYYGIKYLENGELHNGFGTYNLDYLSEYLKEFFISPPADPERKWIPVTEHLPKTNGCYIVWRPHFFGGEIGMPAICYFDGQNTWHDAYGVDFSRVLCKKDITAWMPLPEPPEDPDDHPDR